MREEVISSGGTIDPTPAGSSAGASSPTVPANVGSVDGSIHGQGSKGASISCVGSQPPMTSLSTSAAGGGGGGSSVFGSSRLSCRPWERGDLLRRLATFKPSNWFAKPKVISSLACARRGWVNVDVDKIACESCSASLGFSLLPSWTPDEVQNAAEVFVKQLDSGHKVACPWRGNSCPESLVQFPPTPQSALIGGYKDRFANLMGGEVDFKPESIPELESSRDGAIYLYSRAQRLISLCGWEPRWLLNIQDCEEHSAQSARNGYSIGPTYAQVHLSQEPGSSRKAASASARKDAGKSKVLLRNLGILDFLTIPRPARFTPNNIDIPDTSKKMGLTRGQVQPAGLVVGLLLMMQRKNRLKTVMRTEMSGNIHDVDMGRDLMIGQPAGSEVGDRAASYESRGPSSRKRSLEKGGSSVDRPHLRTQQADTGPSKRARDSDIFDTHCSSGAGPSHSMGLEIYADGNRVASFQQGSDQFAGIHSNRDSARASSVIAMDTICHGTDDDSMESVENYPGDVDDVHYDAHFPTSSTYGNLDMNDTSELNNSNQAQQSIGFQPVADVIPGDMGVSSTNDGEEIFNTETVTAQARDGFSFGISGGSVGMCASHEAEIHGADVSVHRADSVVGDVEPRTEDAENQGQTGESAQILD
ncbi:uncharacterized protein Pyn_39150 [Prunus yedoensis var. nudiflora]|uniref:C3HC-type domain-containing protein n=1 Tax=Prunus yedoensis var. nudiflora TaxID=2094558 RepID=A0A314UZ81_PRUYE|nr:uncharacterized protein Pyn_39150 [Prunus yedoensis var. nudiflora]